MFSADMQRLRNIQLAAREIEIGITRADAVLLRVILEHHNIQNGETADTRRLHDLFAAITRHTQENWTR